MRIRVSLAASTWKDKILDYEIETATHTETVESGEGVLKR